MTQDSKKDQLKKIILKLHEDENIAAAKKEFKEHFGSIAAEKIAELEQGLIESGELTAEEVTKLCDLHVDVFKENIEIPDRPDLVPGHPLHTYRKENAYAINLIRKIRKNFSLDKLIQLSQIQIHYTRLENQLFPQLEEKGFTGPSQVMWSKHDQIRNLFKTQDKANVPNILQAVEDMIEKEEKILFPTARKKLSEQDWVEVARGEAEIGFAWVKPGDQWAPLTPETLHEYTHEDLKRSEQTVNHLENPLLQLSTGRMTKDLLDIMLKTLPLDLSVIDANDEVIYYSDVPNRIFPRSPGVIGRKVINCHPPKSHHIVKRILDAFKANERDNAEFWIHLGEKFVHIRYYALRDTEHQYLGTVEVTQEISHIQELDGDQRLLDWE